MERPACQLPVPYRLRLSRTHFLAYNPNRPTQRDGSTSHTESRPTPNARSKRCVGNRKGREPCTPSGVQGHEQQKAGEVISGFGFRGGDDGIRTHDPHVANVMLSQLSYIPTGLCALSREDTFCLYRCVLSNRNLHRVAKYTRTTSRRERGDDTRPMPYVREYPPAGSQAPRTACRAC